MAKKCVKMNLCIIVICLDINMLLVNRERLSILLWGISYSRITHK